MFQNVSYKNATVITNYNDFIKNATDITKCDVYYKLRQDTYMLSLQIVISIYNLARVILYIVKGYAV